MNQELMRKILSTLPPGFFGANLYDEQEIAAAT